mgnify:CR=1 FL=1
MNSRRKRFGKQRPKRILARLTEFEEEIKTHRDRRLALDGLESKDPDVRDRGFRDRFGAREHHLHERCFYDREYLPEKVREDILKAKEYVDEIESFLK